MKLSGFLSDVGRPLAFYPSLVKAMGNRNDAIFICQMAYWKDRGEDPNGWIYKEAKEIEEETSLTYKEQIRVRKRLKKAKILQEKYYKSIHRMYFRVDWNVLNSLWDVRDLCEAPAQWSYTTCPLVSSLIGNTYTTHRLNKELKKMCDRCEYLKQKIELGKEYGFEFDVQTSIEMLKNLVESHKTESPNNHPKETQAERISAMMQGSKDEYADRLADYPDRCRKHLLYFLHKWNFSPTAVPKKSKSKGGMFATWIAGIDDLVSISGEKRFELVLDKVYEIWDNRSSEYKNVVDMPQKIRPLFVSCDAELRQSNAKQVKEWVDAEKTKQEEVVEYVNPETAVRSLEEFKKAMKRK